MCYETRIVVINYETVGQKIWEQYKRGKNDFLHSWGQRMVKQFIRNLIKTYRFVQALLR